MSPASRCQQTQALLMMMGVPMSAIVGYRLGIALRLLVVLVLSVLHFGFSTC
jgi:hypothetical protein